MTTATLPEAGTAIARPGINRRQALLEAAAAQFLKTGYAATSMRDIAAEAAMKPASIYYHFPSKADLFVEVHKVGLERIRDNVEQALDGVTGAWERLETACIVHLETLLEGDIFFRAVMREMPRHYEAQERQRLIVYRDAYEAIFSRLLDDIDLPVGTDRHDLRLMLLGAMNWSFSWYRPGRETPKMLALKFVDFLKNQLDKGD